MNTFIIIEEEMVITKTIVISPNSTFDLSKIRDVINQSSYLTDRLSVDDNVIETSTDRKLISQKVFIEEQSDDLKSTLIIESISND